MKEKGEGAKNINYPYLLTFVLTILCGSVLYGYSVSIYGACLPLFSKMYEWEDDQKTKWSSIPTTLVPAGALVTALISSKIMEFGKRITFFIAAAIMVIGVLFVSVIHSPDPHHPSGLVYFCFGRVLIGLSIGLYSSATPSFINEIAPTHLTGALGSCHQLFLCFAIVITYLIGSILPKEGDPEELRKTFGWRLGMGIPAIIAIIQSLLLLFVFKYESPAHYSAKGQWANAKDALKRIYNDEDEIEKIVSELQSASNKSSQASNAGSAYTEYKKAFWVGLILPAIQQLTGINIVMFYANTVFEKQGADRASILSLVVMLINFLFTFGSVFLADKLGRKLMLVWGSVGCAIGLFMSFLTLNAEKSETAIIWIFNFSVFFFIAVFEMSHGPITWVYMSEILLPEWMGYGVGVSWAFTILVGVTTPYFFAGIGRWTYFLYFLFMAGSTAFCALFMVETKGKSKDEIMNSFSARSQEAQVALMSQT